MKKQRYLFRYILLLLIITVLSYGYWASKSYGYIYITLSSNNKSILNAQVQLLDKDHSILAEGQSDERYGIVHFKHPKVGYCDKIEKQSAFSSEARNLWQNCSNEQARWTIKWANQVRFLNINTQNCDVKNIPLELRSYHDDWWLWWVPLPHVV